MQNMVPMRDTARLVASQCSLRLKGAAGVVVAPGDGPPHSVEIGSRYNAVPHDDPFAARVDGRFPTTSGKCGSSLTSFRIR